MSSNIFDSIKVRMLDDINFVIEISGRLCFSTLGEEIDNAFDYIREAVEKYATLKKEFAVLNKQMDMNFDELQYYKQENKDLERQLDRALSK